MRRSSSGTARNAQTSSSAVYAGAFPASYREEYGVHDAVGDIGMIETPRSEDRPRHESPRERARRAWHPALQDLPPRQPAAALGQPADARAAGRAGAVRASAQDRARGSGAGLGGRLRPRPARGRPAARRRARKLPRGLLRHVVGRGRSRRAQPPGAERRPQTRARSSSCAPMHATSARPARRSAFPTWSRRSLRTRSSLRCSCACFSAGSIQRPNAAKTSSPRKSKPRSTRSRTSTRTASCAASSP